MGMSFREHNLRGATRILVYPHMVQYGTARCGPTKAMSAFRWFMLPSLVLLLSLQSSYSLGVSAEQRTPLQGVSTSSPSAWLTPNGTLNVDILQTRSFSLSATGGTGTDTFFDFYVNGTLAQSTTSPSIFNYQFMGTGTYVINGSVTDSSGAHASSNVATVVVHPQLQANFALRSPYIDVGVSEIGNASGLNGTPPYSIVLWGCPTLSGNHSRCWVNGTTPGSYNIQANVTDQAGRTAYAAALITVNPPPRIWLNATASVTNVGSKDPLLAAHKGGTNGDAGKYYLVSWGGCPPGEGSSGFFGGTCNFNVSQPGTYQVTAWYNDSWESSAATVNVTVRPGLSATIGVAYPALDVGMQDHLNVSVQYGTAPYTYAWSSGCSPWNGISCNITASAVGTLNVSLMVTDALGHRATAYYPITVNPLPTTTITVPSAVDANKSGVLTFQPSGGTGPLTLGFPSGCVAVNATVCKWTAPAMHGWAPISATVSDQFRTVFVNGSIVVLWGPHVGWLGGRTQLDLGMNTTLTTWLGFAPQPPYANWSFYLGGSQVQNGNRSSLLFAPSAPGSYTFVCHETDVYGETASTGPLAVMVHPHLSVQISAPSSLAVGASGSFVAIIQGGQGPYSVLWMPSGLVTQSYLGWNATFAWRNAGTFEVNLTITDALGQTSRGSTNLTVGASPAPPAALSIFVLGGVALMGVVAGILLLFVLRKKRRDRAVPDAAVSPSGQPAEGTDTSPSKPPGGEDSDLARHPSASGEDTRPTTAAKATTHENPSESEQRTEQSSSPSSAEGE